MEGRRDQDGQFWTREHLFLGLGSGNPGRSFGISRLTVQVSRITFRRVQSENPEVPGLFGGQGDILGGEESGAPGTEVWVPKNSWGTD